MLLRRLQALPVNVQTALALIVLLGIAACAQNPQTTTGAAKDKVVATVGTEPVYQIEIDRLVDDQHRAIRNAESIFAKPAPDERALMQEAALHKLLLDAVYRQPAVNFNKNRAVELTRKVSIEKARAMREELENGVPTKEVLEKYVPETYREPAQAQIDILSTGTMHPAYKEQAFGTPVGQLTQIIEDPSGGYYVLRIIEKSTIETEGAPPVERIVADSFFVPFDKQAGRQLVREEDLKASNVKVIDPVLQVITLIRESRDATEVAVTLAKLNAAKDTLENSKGLPKDDAFVRFLYGWVLEMLATDPPSGATYEAALAAYQQAAELQAKVAPGHSDYGYYLARTGAMQERIGQLEAARATYRTAFEAARDNADLTIRLRQRFEEFNDAEYLAKADAELSRMGIAQSYVAMSTSQKLKRPGGVMAEGVDGMEQVFQVEGESRVIAPE